MKARLSPAFSPSIADIHSSHSSCSVSNFPHATVLRPSCKYFTSNINHHDYSGPQRSVIVLITTQLHSTLLRMLPYLPSVPANRNSQSIPLKSSLAAVLTNHASFIESKYRGITKDPYDSPPPLPKLSPFARQHKRTQTGAAEDYASRLAVDLPPPHTRQGGPNQQWSHHKRPTQAGPSGSESNGKLPFPLSFHRLLSSCPPNFQRQFSYIHHMSALVRQIGACINVGLFARLLQSEKVDSPGIPRNGGWQLLELGDARERG